jgi:hypothetical protein
MPADESQHGSAPKFEKPRITLAETTRSEHRFYVKKTALGQPWLASEILTGQEPGGRGFMELRLAPGTTMQQAEDLARAMNRFIVSTSLTRF